MYREWKKIEFPKEYYIWIWEHQDWEVDHEINGKMRWERIDEQLVEKGGRKRYITQRNGRSSWEQQGIVTFYTCQWNEWMNEWTNEQCHVSTKSVFTLYLWHWYKDNMVNSTETAVAHNSQIYYLNDHYLTLSKSMFWSRCRLVWGCCTRNIRSRRLCFWCG